MVFYKAGCEYVVHSSTGCLDYRHIEMYFFPVLLVYFPYLTWVGNKDIKNSTNFIFGSLVNSISLNIPMLSNVGNRTSLSFYFCVICRV